MTAGYDFIFSFYFILSFALYFHSSINTKAELCDFFLIMYYRGIYIIHYDLSFLLGLLLCIFVYIFIFSFLSRYFFNAFINYNIHKQKIIFQCDGIDQWYDVTSLRHRYGFTIRFTIPVIPLLLEKYSSLLLIATAPFTAAGANTSRSRYRPGFFIGVFLSYSLSQILV